MNSHFITQIEIEKLRHLENIKIELDNNKMKHLLLTGKNGSGKTTVLDSIKKFLSAIEYESSIPASEMYKGKIKQLKSMLNNELDEFQKITIKNQIDENMKNLNSCSIYGININFNCNKTQLYPLYKQGEFILAHYSANRVTSVDVPKGVENITLKNTYSVNENPSSIFVKYLVDLKTQQSFARNENDMDVVDNIDSWFNNFENAMRTILDDSSIKLKFEYRNYNFKILQDNREPYEFNELSQGYSSVLNIVSDLILRIDKNRAGLSKNYIFDTEGIVLIDELESHLHIELQKKILPFLVEFFPNIQFIVTTHSPFVLNSIDNAIIYDLEKNIRVEGLCGYSYEGIVEGFFEIDNYSDELKEKIKKYKELAFKNNLTDDEKALRAELRIELKNSATNLAKELKLEFDEIERNRKK